MKINVLAYVAAMAVGMIPFAAKAHDAKRCTSRMISGKYGIQTKGFSDFTSSNGVSLIGEFAPITSVGLFEFLVDGTFTSSETANVGGFVFPFTGTGTFTVNENCTGTLSRELSIGPPNEDMEFVVVQGGAKILIMSTFPGGRQFSGQLERISTK